MDDQYIVNVCPQKKTPKKFRTSKKLEKEKRAKKSPKWFNDRNEYLDEEYDKDDNVFDNDK